MADYLITETSLVNIANGTRDLTGRKGTLTISDIIELLRQEKTYLDSTLEALSQKGIEVPEGATSEDLATLISNTQFGGSNPSIVSVSSSDSLPTTSNEGTIAILSNITVNNVYVNNNKPSSFSVGDVWIAPVDDATFAYIIGDKIKIPFKALYQYNGNTWEQMDVYQYLSGEWVAAILLLLDGGDTCSDITGGYRYYSWYSGTVTKLATGYKLENSSGYHNAQIQTTNKIDLGGYRTLHCAGNLVSNSEYVGASVTLKIGTNASSSGTGMTAEHSGATDGGSVAQSSHSEVLGEFELVLDITDYNDGSYYVAVNSNAGNCTITKIWLKE